MRGRHFSAAGVVAAVLALSLPSAALAARPAGGSPGASTTTTTTTTTTVPGKAKKHHPKTTTTVPVVPRKAQSLLKRLLKTAGLVSQDNLKAAALSERYDAERYKYSQAELEVDVLDNRVSGADSLLVATRARLRQAAVLAYVTGELTEVDSGIVAGNVSVGEMASVYTGAALSQLRQALRRYSGASSAVHLARAQAVANSLQIARTLAQISQLKQQAESLIKAAAREYTSISKQLRRLVGRKEFARLFSPWPAGSPYKGPNLAGTDVTQVATKEQGRKAAAAARKFLGVPYVFGGASKAGVDCSGLTMLSWAAEDLARALRHLAMGGVATGVPQPAGAW